VTSKGCVHLIHPPQENIFQNNKCEREPVGSPGVHQPVGSEADRDTAVSLTARWMGKCHGKNIAFKNKIRRIEFLRRLTMENRSVREKRMRLFNFVDELNLFVTWQMGPTKGK